MRTSRLGRGQRQHEHGPQPGRVVLEPQRSAVHVRHRRDEAETQPGAGQRTALLEPHETPQHALAVGGGDAGTTIGDSHFGVVSGGAHAQQ